MPLLLALDWTRNLTLLSKSVVLHIAHRVIWLVLSDFLLVVYVAAASHLRKTRADWSAVEAAPAGIAGPVGLGATS